jgi:hypothetical protein
MTIDAKLKNKSVECYEYLRLCAISKNIHCHQSYIDLMRRGMISWLIERATDLTEITLPKQIDSANDLQPPSQITQTIAEMLLKRTRK